MGEITFDTDKVSFIGGVYAGYDYKITPCIVIGAEAGFDLGASDSFARTTATTRAGIDPKWSIDLTARAGYLVQDNTLLYVRGGYSNVRVGVDRIDGTVKQTDEDHRDAWVVGGGVEQAITPNISARLEYRYSDLSEGHGSWSRDQILLGASYRF